MKPSDCPYCKDGICAISDAGFKILSAIDGTFCPMCQVRCLNCGARGPEEINASKAVDRWNAVAEALALSEPVWGGAPT